MVTSSPSTATRKRPTLGIAGFFGHGNYGDELFLSVFEEYFGDDYNLKVLPDLPAKPYFSRPIAEMVKEVDGILLGGGDLVRPWGTDERYFHKEYLTKPVFALGLGVPIRVGSPNEAEKPHIAKRYAAFFNHPNMKFVGVRDEDSRRWMENHVAPATAPLVAAPDIVCALTLPEVTRDPEAKILGIVTRQRPDRDVPDDYTQLENLAKELQSRGWTIRHLILGTGIVGWRDIVNAQDLDVPGKEIVYSQDLDELSRAIGECTTLASMKFHGSVVATMYGVPSIVMIPTSKNRSFMRRIGREDLLSKFDAKDHLERFEPRPADIATEDVAMLRKQATDLLLQVQSAVKEAIN
ncbi:polysaccharide pyruvyl transferase family protein [Paenarthrobacter sp. YAF11_1]|uniref:polysaccharide pyruvyl transferase family protein n=1 Tax=Paenarthrobacter sp. YAF11_1 TaxID=3233074 RepID=UPI003F9C4743